MSDWRPDWRNEAEYPRPDRTEPDLNYWAWQFLRRNHEYQALWEKFAGLPDESPELGIDNGKWCGTPLMDGPLDCFYTKPSATPGETFRQYVQRCDGVVKPMADHICERFHFGPYPIDPAEDQPEALTFPSAADEAFPVFDWAGVGLSPSELGHAVVMFDLSQPIEAQLSAAKSYLMQQEQFLKENSHLAKVEQTRNRPEKYATYLRVLDATDCGATVKEMAALLQPHKDNSYEAGKSAEKAVRANLKKAEQLRDSGYWLIPRLK